MKELDNNEGRTIPVASKFYPSLKQQVDELAKERKWSLSQTILHLTERGLEQEGRQIAAA